MKLEIELDLNKIDYESINKQLAEKIAELNIKEEYDIGLKIENKIDSLISNEIRETYNRYLDKYYHKDEKAYPTSIGYEVINNLSKEKIEAFTKEYLNEFLEKIKEDEIIKETIFTLLPSIFSTILFNNIQNYLHDTERTSYQHNYDLVESKIWSAIDSLKYRL